MMESNMSEKENKQSYISVTVGGTESQLGFSWYFDQPGIGRLTYVKASELNNGEMPPYAACISTEGVLANERGQYSYQLTVKDLERNTLYAYQLTNNGTFSELMTFRTGKNADFSFALIGDPQLDSHAKNKYIPAWKQTLGIISDHEYFDGIDFILSVGDQIEEYNDEDDYAAYLEHEQMRRFPVATAIGNHESDSPLYHMHFNVANFSDYGKTAAGSDNYFTYNGVLFIVLNTNIHDVEEHRAFIRQTMDSNPVTKWRIAVFHNSIFTAGKHSAEGDLIALRNKLVPVLSESGIDVALMGHDHIYCRTYIMDGVVPVTDPKYYDNENYSSVTDPKGILYITVNSALGIMTHDITGEYGYAAVVNQEHIPNVSRVNISEDRFNVITYRTTDMTVVDKFTINRSR